MEVPVVDIGPFRRGDGTAKAEVAREVSGACRDIGFLIIKGHGIDPELIAATDRVSREFFDLPLETKMGIVRPERSVTRGYIPMETESLAASRGLTTACDLNESIMVSRPRLVEKKKTRPSWESIKGLTPRKKGSLG